MENEVLYKNTLAFINIHEEEDQEVERDCLLGEEGKGEPNMVADNRNEVEDFMLTVDVPETAHQISTGILLAILSRKIVLFLFCF